MFVLGCLPIGESKGFTVLELLITLAVAIVLTVYAVPTFVGQVREGALQKTASNVVASLSQARSEAMKRNHWVTMCKSSDGAICNTGASWKDGWILFSDEDSDGAKDGTDEEVIRTYGNIKSGFALTPTDSNFTNWVAFQPSGTAKGNAGNSDTFKLCYGSDLNYSRAIAVSMAGSVKLISPSTACP